MTHFLFSGQRFILIMIGFGFAFLFIAGFVPYVTMLMKGFLTVISISSFIVALYYVVKEYNKEYAEIK